MTPTSIPEHCCVLQNTEVSIIDNKGNFFESFESVRRSYHTSFLLFVNVPGRR